MENAIDPENEVKKLQDLVRKLEKQNELLRSKADAIGSPTHNANGTLPLSEANTNLNANTNSIADIKSGKAGDSRTKNHKNLLESVKVLEIQSEESDDDTWLYQSPIKAASPDQKGVSPYDWVRQDFEHPGWDQESAKKSLLAKLDEVSRANRNSMGSSNLMALQQPQANHGSPDPLRGIEKLEMSPRNQSPRSQSPRSQSPRSVSPPPSLPHRGERRQSHEERMPAGLSRLEDVTDVQILARMQEESLRQATQMSPANSPRRISVSPSSSENALHRPASRSSSMSSTEGKSEDGDERGTVVRRRPSFERIRKASEGNERKDISPRGVPDGRNGEMKHNAVNRLRGSEEGAKVNGLQGTLPSSRNGTPPGSRNGTPPGSRNGTPPVSRNGTPPSSRNGTLPSSRNGDGRRLTKTIARRSPSLENPPRTQKQKAPEKQPGHRGSMPNLNNRTYVIHPPAPHPTPCTPPPTPMNNENPYPPEAGMEMGGSRMRQPNSSIPVNRAPSPRTLKQPSPTKLRGASPHRSSGNKSGIPRPRSAIVPKSGIPTPASKGSVVSPRGSVKTRDDSWREGCY